MSYPFKGIIPNKFNIGGVETKVIFVNNEMNNGNFGSTDPLRAQVKIQHMAEEREIDKSQQNLTFWHEVVHLILDTMHEKQDPEENERFTSCFSSILNEVIQSCQVED